MKRFVPFILSALLIVFAAAPLILGADLGANSSSPVKLEQLFHSAGQAYDRGDLEQAIAGYNELLGMGYISRELFFNLGNAYFHAGDPGRAVLNYRRAWYLAPRDPDIAANLRFALESTDAVTPPAPLRIRLLEILNREEWAIALMALYWMALITLTLILLIPGIRYAAWRVLIVLGAALLIALLGFFHWSMLYRIPEAVILDPRQPVAFAPLENSTIHFELPEGSIVRVIDRQHTWREIRADKKEGWLPADHCEEIWDLPIQYR